MDGIKSHVTVRPRQNVSQRLFSTVMYEIKRDSCQPEVVSFNGRKCCRSLSMYAACVWLGV